MPPIARQTALGNKLLHVSLPLSIPIMFGCFGGRLRKLQPQAQHFDQARRHSLQQQQQQVPLQNATMNTSLYICANKRAEADRSLLEAMQELQEVINETNMALRLMDEDPLMFVLKYLRNDKLLDLLLARMTGTGRSFCCVCSMCSDGERHLSCIRPLQGTQAVLRGGTWSSSATSSSAR